MYKESMRQTWVEIDLSALDHNIKAIKEAIGSAEIIGIVKADAYGHGSVRCAKVLRSNGVSRFAVATVEEALTLREAGFNETIIILGAGLFGDKVPPLLAQRLDKGLAIYEKFNRKPVIIVSGGQGDDEWISEAKAMAGYLLSKKFPP